MPYTHVTKNFLTDNGDELVINGRLTIGEGAVVTGGGFQVPAANQADSTATTVAGLKEDFNSLLAKLKASGLMAADAEDSET